MQGRSVFSLLFSVLVTLNVDGRSVVPAEKLSQDGEGVIYAVDTLASDQVEVNLDNGNWTLTVRVSSPNASGLQFLVDSLRLPQGAQLQLRSANGETIARYSAVGPLQGDSFWTAVAPGPEAILRVEFAGASLSSLPFRLVQIRHLFADGMTRAVDSGPQGNRSGDEDTPAGQGYTRFRGAVVPFAVRNGVALLEGDIVLGPVAEVHSVSVKEAAGQRASQGISGDYYRWASGIVPYEIDPSLPNQNRISTAISHWNGKLAGVITLQPRQGETYYVRFVNTNSPDTCTSYIGNVHIPGQAITIGANCTTGNVIHEIGHAVGLFHEHTREDRNTFVRLHAGNVAPGSLPNFEQAISTSDDIGAYDYGSIMHYGAYAFSSNGQPTLETIPAGIPIGQRDGLSAGDIAGVKSMYPGKPQMAPALVPVTIASTPAGQTVSIDGTTAQTPVTLDWLPGSVHTISARNSISNGTRQTFRSWSDGGAQTHTVIAPPSPLTITANFQKQFQVMTNSSNSGLGTVVRLPASVDSFYDAGTNLQVLASPKGAACLSSWAGVTAPPGTPVQVIVDQPYQITGNFQTGSVTASLARINVSRSGGSGTVAVASSSGCTWMARADANWITIHSGSTGTASGSIEFSLERKSGTAIRTGTITVGDAVVTIHQ